LNVCVTDDQRYTPLVVVIFSMSLLLEQQELFILPMHRVYYRF